MYPIFRQTQLWLNHHFWRHLGTSSTGVSPAPPLQKGLRAWRSPWIQRGPPVVQPRMIGTLIPITAPYNTYMIYSTINIKWLFNGHLMGNNGE